MGSASGGGETEGDGILRFLFLFFTFCSLWACLLGSPWSTVV